MCVIKLPRGKYNTDVINLVSNYYIGSRSTERWYSDVNNINFYKIYCFSFDTTTKIEYADSLIDTDIKQNRWLVELIHGLDSNGYSPIKSSFLKQHLD
ncbi:MAG: hypothetical protein Q8880_00630 [Bacteroidota bacterium]|nr:hypothetical protein [Bacteroidota bacterium]